MTAIQIGRLLRANTSGCVVGCRVNQINVPVLGAMVLIPLEGADGVQVYGLIHDIHIDDDGLVRQLVTAESVSDDVILDNRLNRNVPLEISVLFIGYLRNQQVFHLLPPRPPLTLDAIYLCKNEDICRFTAGNRFGYFRHILRAIDLPVGEILAAHIQQAASAQHANGNAGWVQDATRELITLLRDDYPTLMAVLGALGDGYLPWENPA